jgi:hypothetical protein
MEEMIRREKFLYEQKKENPTFQKAWEDKEIQDVSEEEGN